MKSNNYIHDDLSAFNQLFNDYQDRFIHFAFSYINDRMAAEDIVMESMMYYWENRNRLQAGTNSPAYILTSIKNKCLNHLRDRQKFINITEDLQDHEEWKRFIQIKSLEEFEPKEIFTSEMRLMIKKALDNLPDTTQQIFVQRHFKDKSYREISMEMNMTIKGVEYHMNKAHEILRHHLKEYLPTLLFFLINK